MRERSTQDNSRERRAPKAGGETSREILAIFDFCETLVDRQSLAPFLALCARENPSYRPPHSYRAHLGRKLASYLLRLTKGRLDSLAQALESRARLPTYPELAGLPLQVATQLAKDYCLHLESHTNRFVLERLEWHKAMGHRVIVVSGGLGIYIRPFMQRLGIEEVLAVELESLADSRGRLTLSGERAGIHTMQERKLYALDSALELHRYHLPDCYAYSDCPSDIPLLALVGKPYVIQAGHSAEELGWARILGYPILSPTPQTLRESAP